MARIYLSSTYRDLVAYRGAVYRALRRLGHDVVAMEDYVATDHRPKDKCLADVAQCDMYVGIFAWRVGFVPPGESCSITELEWRQAQACGKPDLVFVLDDSQHWPKTRRDANPVAITALRRSLQTGRVVSHFRSASELAELTATAVTNRLRESSAAEVLIDVGTAPDTVDATREDTHVLAALLPRYRVINRSPLVIEPRFEHVEAIARGEIVQGLGKSTSVGFPARWPRLAARVVDNAGVTIATERIVLLVQHSAPIDWPLCVPAGYARPARHILVVNEGSGCVGPMRLHYGFTSWHTSPRGWRVDQLPYEMELPAFESSCFVDLSEGLAQEGVHLRALNALRPTMHSYGGPKTSKPGHWIETAAFGWLVDTEYKYACARRVAQPCVKAVASWPCSRLATRKGHPFALRAASLSSIAVDTTRTQNRRLLLMCRSTPNRTTTSRKHRSK
ncbi:DUF4062 domain-containing protein [Variovorax sp. GT1P44]|uniref:DUF4062 domain-containing protein n=1 Tax=Variovorax sp. GT1P44 TaxID=3443742 RepID=UPI003F45759C